MSRMTPPTPALAVVVRLNVHLAAAVESGDEIRAAWFRFAIAVADDLAPADLAALADLVRRIDDQA